MRVLVTGGAGFIGSHIVDALRDRGDDPVVLDDFSTGSRDNLPIGQEIILADVAQSEVVDAILATEADAIIHAAAQASVPRSMADPVHDRAVNLRGTQHVIEAARKLGEKRIVFLSTGGGIYGETHTPATEENPPRPKSFYSLHKYAAEKYIEFSEGSYAIARLANIYGPRQRSHLEGGVVAIFTERLAKERPLTIYGTGKQRRDLVHVHDTANAILRMLDAEVNGMWNVGTGTTTTINDLLALMERIIQPSVNTHHEPPRVGDVFSSCLSPRKINAELGWQQSTPLTEGIQTLTGRER